MDSVALRLFLFFVIFPLILALTLVNFAHHLALNLLITAASIIGAIEMGQLLKVKGFPVNTYLPPLWGLSFPVLAYLEIWNIITAHHTLAIITFLVFLVFVRQIFTNKDEEIKSVINKVTGNLFILIYPGLFFYYTVKISSFDETGFSYIVFALLTFGNDAMAWLFGNLFGKYSKKPFTVSPNKSNVGFFAGFVASIVVAVGSFFLLPYFFHIHIMGNNLFAAIMLGILVGLTTIIGDLFESALKRSAGKKDSGSVIPGRGGMLDSVDSLLFSAPLFYVYLLLFRG